MKFENKVQIQKSLTSTAASQMKKAFGLQSSGSSEIQRSSSFKSKKAPTMAETLRVQMHISEHSDMRTRRALSRATPSQVNWTFFLGSSFDYNVELRHIYSVNFRLQGRRCWILRSFRS
jgi:hypothetical protein